MWNGYLGLAAVVLLQAHAAWGACAVTGDVTLECGGVTYRAVDDECVYYVDLAAHQAAYPDVPLPPIPKTILQNYASDALPAPVVVALTDYVDCARTDHNFSDANRWPQARFPNKPSRLMTISGRTFRVTAAPTDGFATYYYSYDVTTGGIAGVPHLLCAELSNDQERYTTLQIHHPDSIVINPGLPWAAPYAGEPTINPWGDPWYELNTPRVQQGPVFGPDVGVTFYTGLEQPVTNQPYNVSLIFHPKTVKVQVGVTSMGVNTVRTASDGGAVSRMWVMRFVSDMADGFPVHTEPQDPTRRRHIGIYMTHPLYFYLHYGTPIRVLAQRTESLRRLVQHMRFCGFNYIVFNAINGADRSEKTWYPGSSFYNWNSAGDLLSELPPIAAEEGIDLVPLITSLDRPDGSGGLTFTNDSYQLNTNNEYTRAFGNPTLDPLRPEVQQLVLRLIDEIGERCASNPAVRGIGIRASGMIGTCYTAHQDSALPARRSGYSAWDLQQYKDATGSDVPLSPPGTAYTWLMSRPAEWEAWINWRCVRTREFWLACRDRVRSHRPDLLFVVQAELPARSPATNIQWGAGETPRDLLRHHGYDPDLFANDEGILITRGMMIARDRNKNSARWGPPIGTNWQNYRLFHFAPGLAEMYRTAAGRSCEFWQNYWEENENPYFEFGSPGSSFFRTQTPAAPERFFFEAAAMSMRRQDPDTMTWLGWNRPTLGHENDLRKFAQAFRALPAVEPVAFAGTVVPDLPQEVVARWYDDRLCVINDSPSSRTITLNFSRSIEPGKSLRDVVTGRWLVEPDAVERSTASFNAEAFSLNTFLYSSAPPTPVPTIPGDLDSDGDVDQGDFGLFQACYSGGGVPVAANCLKADLDRDYDVDLNDLYLLDGCTSGADMPGDPDCLP